MDNDDRPVGRILGRRQALKILPGRGRSGSGRRLRAGVGPADQHPQPGASYGAAATAVPAEATSLGSSVAMPTCVVRPELSEGPYFVDERLNRSDIRSDPDTGVVEEGALLALTFKLSQVGDGSCTPLEGAWVDIWHCTRWVLTRTSPTTASTPAGSSSCAATR